MVTSPVLKASARAAYIPISIYRAASIHRCAIDKPALHEMINHVSPLGVACVCDDI